MDSAGDVYVTGGTDSTSGFGGPIQGGYSGGYQDAFVAKFNLSPGGSGAPVYRTYLGGADWDSGSAIAVDNQGNAYVTGSTASTGLAVNARYPTLSGPSDTFMAQINPAGTALVSNTYLGGGGYDGGSGIAVDPGGTVYIASWTDSATFPGAGDPQARFAGGFYDAFAAVIPAAEGAPVASTFLGGSDFDEATGIAVDSAGNTYLTGLTYSGDFLGRSGLQGPEDAFIAKLNFGGSFQLSVTDVEGRPVNGLGLNSAGWPMLNAETGAIANPLTVTITVPNPLAATALKVIFGSPNKSTRFYVGAEPQRKRMHRTMCSHTRTSSSLARSWGRRPTAGRSGFSRQATDHST